VISYADHCGMGKRDTDGMRNARHRARTSRLLASMSGAILSVNGEFDAKINGASPDVLSSWAGARGGGQVALWPFRQH